MPRVISPNERYYMLYYQYLILIFVKDYINTPHPAPINLFLWESALAGAWTGELSECSLEGVSAGKYSYYCYTSGLV